MCGEQVDVGLQVGSGFVMDGDFLDERIAPGRLLDGGHVDAASRLAGQDVPGVIAGVDDACRRGVALYLLGEGTGQRRRAS